MYPIVISHVNILTARTSTTPSQTLVVAVDVLGHVVLGLKLVVVLLLVVMLQLLLSQLRLLLLLCLALVLAVE